MPRIRVRTGKVFWALFFLASIFFTPAASAQAMPDLFIETVTLEQDSADASAVRVGTVRVTNMGDAPTAGPFAIEFFWVLANGQERVLEEDIVTTPLTAGESREFTVSHYLENDLSTAPQNAVLLRVRADYSPGRSLGNVLESNEENNLWEGGIRPNLYASVRLHQDPAKPNTPIFHEFIIYNNGATRAGIQDGRPDIWITYDWLLADGTYRPGEDDAFVDFMDAGTFQVFPMEYFVGTQFLSAPADAVAVRLWTNRRSPLPESILNDNVTLQFIRPDLVIDDIRLTPPADASSTARISEIVVRNKGFFPAGVTGSNVGVSVEFFWVMNDGSEIAGEDTLPLATLGVPQKQATFDVSHYVTDEALTAPAGAVAVRAVVSYLGPSAREHDTSNNELTVPIPETVANEDTGGKMARREMRAALDGLVRLLRGEEQKDERGASIKGALPDLTITDVEIGVRSPARAGVTIQNIGRGVSPDTTTENRGFLSVILFNESGQEYLAGRTTLPSLQPGESWQATFSSPSNLPPLFVPVRIRVVVDEDLFIPESNEDNNVWESGLNRSNDGSYAMKATSAEEADPLKDLNKSGGTNRRLAPEEPGEIAETFKPKILPGNPFYFIKNAGREIRSAFTFNEEKKASLRLRYASERLLETHLLVERGNAGAAQANLKRYGKDVKKLSDIIQGFDPVASASVTSDIVRAELRHQVVLGGLTKEARELRDELALSTAAALGRLSENVREEVLVSFVRSSPSTMAPLRQAEALRLVLKLANDAVKASLSPVLLDAEGEIADSLILLEDDDMPVLREYIEYVGGHEDAYLEIVQSLDTSPQGRKVVKQLNEIRKSLRERLIRESLNEEDGESSASAASSQPVSCSETEYECSEWGSCVSDAYNTGQHTQYRRCACPGSSVSVLQEQACAAQVSGACTEDTWECDNWGQCMTDTGRNGQYRNRTCRLTRDCPNVETPPPASSERCDSSGQCAADQWNCNWSECRWLGPEPDLGLQRVTECYKVFDCPNVDTPSYTNVGTVRACRAEQPCTEDEYVCEDWENVCYPVSGTEGRQPRRCTMVRDCPNVLTPPPEQSRDCTVTREPSCTADEWNCNWTDCSADGTQSVRECYKVFDCASADTPAPNEVGDERSCTPIARCTEDVYECGEWESACHAVSGTQGRQSRTCRLVTDCPNVRSAVPNGSRDCTVTREPSCTADEWNCNWNDCAWVGPGTEQGEQSVRECYKVFDCASADTPAPNRVGDKRACSARQSCTADTWSCGEWGSCTWTGPGTEQGSRTRTCSKTNDCAGVDTPRPAQSQDCSASQPIPACTESDWNCHDFGSCSAQGSQSRECYKINTGCQGGYTPGTTQACTRPVSTNPSALSGTIPLAGTFPRIQPSGFHIAYGGTVTITNNDTVSHTVRLSWNGTITIPAGGSVTITVPDEEGTYYLFYDDHTEYTALVRVY